MKIPSSTKSVRRHLLGNGATVAIAQIISIGFIFAQNVILARILGLENFGLFQLLFTFASLALVFGRPGATTVIGKGVIKGYDAIIRPEMRRSIRSGMWWASAIVAMAVGAGLCGYPYVASVSVVIAVFALLSCVEKFDAILQAKQAWWASRSLVIAQSAASCVASGATAWYTHSPWLTLASVFVVRVILVIIGWRAVRRLMNDVPREPVRELELQQEGTAYTRIAWLNQAADHVGRLILGLMDPALLAVYSVGSIIPRRIVENAKLVMAVPIVHLSTTTPEANLQALVRWFPASLVAGVIAAIGLCVTSPYVIPWLYGPQYQGAVWISQVLSLTLVTAFSGVLILAYDINQKDGKFFRAQRVLRLSSFIVLSIVGVYYFQVTGAIVAQLIVEGVFGVSTLLYLLRMWKGRVAFHSSHLERFGKK